MPLDTLAVLLGLGLLAAALAGARLPEPLRRTRSARSTATGPTTTDDGPLGLGSGRTTWCPVCTQPALELVGVSIAAGHSIPRVQCAACLSTYTVRGTLSSVPIQRRTA